VWRLPRLQAWRGTQLDKYTFMGYFSFGKDGQQLFDAYPTAAWART
jgi:hypothetical protein